MQESIFHTTEHYENYVLGKLSNAEEGTFEEHLLSCSYCREQLVLHETIITTAKNQENEIQLQPVKQSSQKRIRLILRIAASLVLIAGLTVLFNIHLENSTSRKFFDQVVLNDTIIPNISPPAKSVEVDIHKPKLNSDQSITLLAEAYQPLGVYENAIENNLRAGSLQIISPSIAKEFNSTDSIIFEWETNASGLLLVLFDNYGKLLFEENVSPPFLLKQELDIGLYYWQLENTEESLFTGKFLIKK